MFVGVEAFLSFLGKVAKIQAAEGVLRPYGRLKDKTDATIALFRIMDAFGMDVEWVAA